MLKHPVFRIVLILLLITSCSYKPPSNPDQRPGRGFNIFPVWYDNMLGAEYGDYYVYELPLIRNARVERGVRDLGMHIVNTYYGDDHPEFDFEFHVVNLDIMNAFALPGGKIFVFRGLLEDLESESEVAGVLAHEIGHVVARHGTKNLSKGIMLQSLVLTGSAILSAKDHDDLALLAYIGGSIASSLRLMKYSRDYEREADWIGVHQVYKSGYDPNGMLSLFRHFEDAEKAKAAHAMMFLSTHPSPQERQQNVGKELLKLAAGQEPPEKYGFYQLRSELRAMPPAPKEWKGRAVSGLTSMESLGKMVAESKAQSLDSEMKKAGTQTHKFYIPANTAEWKDTSVEVKPGQRLEMKKLWRPVDGTPEPDSLLVAVYKNEEQQQIADAGQELITIEKAGRLYFGIEDDSISDNAGWFEVVVTFSR